VGLGPSPILFLLVSCDVKVMIGYGSGDQVPRVKLMPLEEVLALFSRQQQQQQQQQQASTATDGTLGGKVSGKLTANTLSPRAQAAAKAAVAAVVEAIGVLPATAAASAG
jgi:hypothetical protein